MFNEHNIEQIHTRIEAKPITTTDFTILNIIIPIIPEPVRDIMDFTLLVMGTSLNAFLSFVIILNSSMYTTNNCYIMTLVFSNLIILLEPLQQMLRWICDINLEMNLDYIFLLTFATSILTIIVLNVEAYILICQKNSILRKSLLKMSTAIKSTFCIWIMCILMTSLELHLYDHYEKEVVYDIYVAFTIMFLIFPCFIFIMLDGFILYDLIKSKSIIRMWSSKYIERFIFLVAITIGFFLTMMPYRIMKAISLMTSNTFCCSDTAIEIAYTMVKIYPMLLPIIYFVTSKEFRQALEMTLRCQRYKNSTVT